MVKRSFNNVKAFMFDLDGTIWKWSELLPHAAKVIEQLQEKKKKVYFVTNNAALSRKGIVTRLRTLGIKTEEKNVLSSGTSAARFFESQGIKKVYLSGERGLMEELELHGVHVRENAKTVLVGVDRNFNYWKLKHIYDLWKNGAKIYATGCGKHWYVGNDIFPGEAPFIKAIEHMTGEDVKILGKPSDEMKKFVLDSDYFYPEDTVLIGDDLDTDIFFGNKCGFRTVLVLTGDTNEKEIKEVKEAERKPSIVIKDLRDLIEGI